MTIQPVTENLRNPQLAVGQIVHHLAQIIANKLDRNTFFQILAGHLRHLFHYDRFCINLYDAEREFLNLFTAADGTVIESLSNTRVARNTVAGLAIASRKPVVIDDLKARNISDGSMRLSSVGLNATIAVPLIINDEVIATMHASFVHQPEHVVDILNVLIELAPIVSMSLSVVLTEEREQQARCSHLVTNADTAQQIENRLLDTDQMSSVMAVARKVAKLNIPVLLTGETGTGKSILARWLHRHSPRCKENFVKVNCPSIASSLFESEMFGYAKGAFTGATSKHIGRIELAQYGTLFLDEIGELSTEMQSKLLQVLEENSFERVGEASSINVDIRVLAATNKDLQLAMSEGLLRRDLYYRLASVVIRMPPLRERKNDIPIFIDYFIRQFSTRYGINPPRLDKDILQRLHDYAWPGNIRELRNTISRILLHSLDAPVTEKFLDDVLQHWETSQTELDQSGVSHIDRVYSFDMPLPTLEEQERTLIQAALRRTGGRVSGPNGAAVQLGIARTSLQHKMRKLGIQRL